MFSLLYLRFVLCSRDLEVLCVQRIMGIFILIAHKPKRSENPIAWFLEIFVAIWKKIYSLNLFAL